MTIINTLIVLATPLEMLCINLFVIDRCSEKKFSPARTYSIMAVAMVMVIYPSYLFISRTPGFGSGNGLFVFLGFIFMFPVKMLYKNSVEKIISLACTSWVYTFFVFSLSVHISYMVKTIPQALTTLIVQTFLYVISFMWFYKKLKYNFFPMLSQLTPEENNSLMWMSIVWFWTAFIVNFSFIYGDVYVLRILSILSLVVCSFNFYWYTYRVINSGRAIKSLEQIAYHDSLTQLRSRALLGSDVEQLINREIPFCLVFMDLNNFKQINDSYGHNAGDKYLAFFAQETKKIIGNNGGFYRIAGDEFVGILIETDTADLLHKLQQFPKTIDDTSIPFLGVSYGVAAYPDEGQELSELLGIADMRMYQMKKEMQTAKLAKDA